MCKLNHIIRHVCRSFSITKLVSVWWKLSLSSSKTYTHEYLQVPKVERKWLSGGVIVKGSNCKCLRAHKWAFVCVWERESDWMGEQNMVKFRNHLLQLQTFYHIFASSVVTVTWKPEVDFANSNQVRFVKWNGVSLNLCLQWAVWYTIGRYQV